MRCMNRTTSGWRAAGRPIAAALLLATLAAAPASASVVQIEFSGRLVRDSTSGASPELENYLQSHFDGLSVRARFDIALDTADIDPQAQRADYRGAVLSSSLQIAGAALTQSTQTVGFDCSSGPCLPVQVPYCGDLQTLDCTVQVRDNVPAGGPLHEDSVFMRSHSFTAPGTVPLSAHVFPMTSFNFLHSLFTIDGSDPNLVTDTGLTGALADMLAHGDRLRINLQGMPLDGICGNDCYAASWRIDDLAFGPGDATGTVPEPHTAGLVLLALGGLASVSLARPAMAGLRRPRFNRRPARP